MAETQGGGLRVPGPNDNPSPFVKPATREKRAKIAIYGEWSTGKTRLALEFPNVALIDFESGSEAYEEKYDFEVLPASTWDQLSAAVEWLSRNSHGYRTLVIDPITVAWEALQKKWSDIFLLRRGGKKEAFEFYDLSPRDWTVIKAELKAFFRRLIALDMNVVVIAREKDLYADSRGKDEMMRKVGTTFDADRSLPYWFDTVIRCAKDGAGRFTIQAKKDRNEKLSSEAVVVESPRAAYGVIEKALGESRLRRRAKPIDFASPGLLKKLQDAVKRAGFTDEQLASRLAAYNAEKLEDLTKEAALAILAKLEAYEAKLAAAVATKEAPIAETEPAVAQAPMREPGEDEDEEEAARTGIHSTNEALSA